MTHTGLEITAATTLDAQPKQVSPFNGVQMHGRHGELDEVTPGWYCRHQDVLAGHLTVA